MLVRQHRYTCIVSSYCHLAVALVALARLVRRRWRVADELQDAKEICHVCKSQVI
ncbi:hypothetical protein [Streptomyces phaeochromogenes]|uniref:hypothetical protein n=1 Tax=Streptomyces phaeochromogenes TaxID=1923 RepID=UPI002E1613FC|nr:hypothetical protein OG437_33255 [Streptomyces phaeochromogenes]